MNNYTPEDIQRFRNLLNDTFVDITAGEFLEKFLDIDGASSLKEFKYPMFAQINTECNCGRISTLMPYCDWCNT